MSEQNENEQYVVINDVRHKFEDLTPQQREMVVLYNSFKNERQSHLNDLAKLDLACEALASKITASVTEENEDTEDTSTDGE
jgi:peptidoglycan hydrolase CwlO-like protein